MVTIGCIQSGEAPNVVNAAALMKLSVRALHKETRELVVRRIQEVAVAQAASFGARAEVKIINSSPVLVNGDEATAFAMKTASALARTIKYIRSIPKWGVRILPLCWKLILTAVICYWVMVMNLVTVTCTIRFMILTMK